MQMPRWLFLVVLIVAFGCGSAVEYRWEVVQPLGAAVGRMFQPAWVQQVFLVAIGVVAGLAVGLLLFSRLSAASLEMKTPRRPELRGEAFEREEMRRRVRASRGQ